MRVYRAPKLLVIDEMGYLPLDVKRSTELPAACIPRREAGHYDSLRKLSAPPSD